LKPIKIELEIYRKQGTHITIWDIQIIKSELFIVFRAYDLK